MNWKRHNTKFGTKLGRCGVTGKAIFRTEGAAKKRIKEIINDENNRCNGYLRAFQCHRCGFWHLTSKANTHYEDRNETQHRGQDLVHQCA